ncbi:hypothetical protein VKT23_000096 [Stygiomarasmius scandens]|uniref:Uncharacterized protein n=1 Tax=Marasmiellus scandens TaxID=2682957 RepID=A0ABR1K341_9AGAR
MAKGTVRKRFPPFTKKPPVKQKRSRAKVSKPDDEVPSLLRFRLQESDDNPPVDEDEVSSIDTDLADVSNGNAMEVFKRWESKSRNHQDLVTALVANASSGPSSSALSARLDAAVAETKKGLKGKKPAQKIAGQKRVTNAKGKGKATARHNDFEVQAIVFIPSGIIQVDKSHRRKHTHIYPHHMLPMHWRKTCTVASLQSLVKRGLAVIEADNGFAFQRDMTQAAVLRTLKEHMPDVFSYLESIDSDEDLPYVFCNREKGEFVVVPGVDNPDGADVYTNSRDSKRGFSNSMIVLASRRPVPKSVLQGWSSLACNDSESEDEDADDENDDLETADSMGEDNYHSDCSLAQGDFGSTSTVHVNLKRRRIETSDEDDNLEDEASPTRTHLTKKRRLTRAVSPLATVNATATLSAGKNNTGTLDIIELSSDDPDTTLNTIPSLARTASHEAYHPDPLLNALSLSAWSSERRTEDII